MMRFFWVLLLFCLIACKKESIRTYTVKRSAQVQSQLKNTFPIPQHWQTQPSLGMRLGSFKLKDHAAKDCDISVVVLPTGSGGDLANINRWRGQLGLSPLKKGAPGSKPNTINLNQKPVAWVEISAQDRKMVVAYLTSPAQTIFIKMMGTSSLVNQEAAHFKTFVSDSLTRGLGAK